MASLFSGTSGFAYPAWKPEFYPPGLPQRRFLEHYAKRLNAVEINYTFRRLPSATTLAGWANATPPSFAFAIKAHQRITHVHRLKEAGDVTAYFFEALAPLRSAGRLGPVLFQLPRYVKLDRERLAAYLEHLPSDVRVTFEFRDRSWLVDDVFDLLREHHVSLCIAESEMLHVPEVVTADFIYYRLRKPSYSDAEIEAFAARCLEHLAGGRDLYAMFKHEQTPAGALHAERLLSLVAGAAPERRAAA
jgi:uncharacterized protein YecE (DUF72 family)